MKCNRCQRPIPANETHEHAGGILCEDCYMDALSPTRFCDPWADYCAKSFEKSGGKPDLTEKQETLLRLIKELGEAEPADLIERLQGEISPSDGERECAALLRMKKIEIANVAGKAILRNP